MLEYWVDTPEIQRSAHLYEDLIKCCIADATSEVFIIYIMPLVHSLFLVRLLKGIPQNLRTNLHDIL
jgi:hypothetical protein